MKLTKSSSRKANGRAAASYGAGRLRETLAQCGEARVIVATGASQFEMLEALLGEPGIAWEKMTFFHLDKYVGLPVTHPASFRRYLWERFHSKLPTPARAFHYVAGDRNPVGEGISQTRLPFPCQSGLLRPAQRFYRVFQAGCRRSAFRYREGNQFGWSMGSARSRSVLSAASWPILDTCSRLWPGRRRYDLHSRRPTYQ